MIGGAVAVVISRAALILLLHIAVIRAAVLVGIGVSVCIGIRISICICVSIGICRLIVCSICGICISLLILILVLILVFFGRGRIIFSVVLLGGTFGYRRNTAVRAVIDQLALEISRQLAVDDRLEIVELVIKIHRASQLQRYPAVIQHDYSRTAAEVYLGYLIHADGADVFHKIIVDLQLAFVLARELIPDLFAGQLKASHNGYAACCSGIAHFKHSARCRHHTHLVVHNYIRSLLSLCNADYERRRVLLFDLRLLDKNKVLLKPFLDQRGIRAHEIFVLEYAAHAEYLVVAVERHAVYLDHFHLEKHRKAKHQNYQGHKNKGNSAITHDTALFAP